MIIHDTLDCPTCDQEITVRVEIRDGRRKSWMSPAEPPSMDVLQYPECGHWSDTLTDAIWEIAHLQKTGKRDHL